MRLTPGNLFAYPSRASESPHSLRRIVGFSEPTTYCAHMRATPPIRCTRLSLFDMEQNFGIGTGRGRAVKKRVEAGLLSFTVG